MLHGEPGEMEARSEVRHKKEESSIEAKALATIEGMILAVEPEDKMLSACYRFAHVASGHCQNQHEDWLEELNKTYEQLRKDHIL